MLSGTEIQKALDKFVAKWSDYTGSEKAGAQTFLNELFEAYGSDRHTVGALFEDFKSSAGFMDLHWPGTLIVEMKGPNVALEKAKEQRVRYWQESSNSKENIPAARWVVTCNFREFEVWEPGRFPNEPRIRFPIGDLPDHYDALIFLQSDTIDPVFSEHRRELTKDAARHIAELYTSMADRSAAPIDEIHRFTMQLVWCLFAEDLGMLEGFPLQNTVDVLLKEKEPDSARDIGHLFNLLNQKSNHNRQGRYAGTRYVNGDLFAKPAAVYLTRAELLHLRDAAEFNWREVNPTIFGSLMEGVLGDERRGELGAHYTHEADIMKIVSPTIVRPWRERIEKTTTPDEAKSLLDELCKFTILDPAAGCGNFLYVGYRELRGLEFELKQRIVMLSQTTGAPIPAGPLPYYPLSNVRGIEIEGIAVLIARVTLWMGHRQMVERYGDAEPVLPLVDLSGIRAADALRTEWPSADAIIGNPPFLGSQLLRSGLGGPYVEWLGSHFGVGVRDLCVYWFRRAQDQLKPGQRAGLVGTNSIMQNRGREASLDYLVADGGVITDAVSTQKWPGDANVHVSIVNWVKQPPVPPSEFELDGVAVAGITSSLTEGTGGEWAPVALSANKGRCFQGPIPVGGGFIIEAGEAARLLSKTLPSYSDVVRPYLTGSDIADSPTQSPGRWTIDFGQLALEKAGLYPEALAIVRSEVKPFRETVRREGHRKKWWLFGEPRVGMRKALQPLARYATVGAHGKRMLIAWTANGVVPSNANMVFSVDDDYSMGILLSRAHDAWAWARSSTLETRIRYTPTTVFETFPWPDPISQSQRDSVAAASLALYARRSAICTENNLGLTSVYNLMDDGAFADLAALQKSLDEAVVAAYGWPKSVAQKPLELVSRLTQLNKDIFEKRREYEPFTSSSAMPLDMPFSA